jgi:1-acyl-sn-glycerol-3-phosphate acyltransferase
MWQYLGSFVFTAYLFVFTPIYAIPVALSAMLPYRTRARLVHGFGTLTLGMLRVCCGLTYTVEGRERMPQGVFVAMWKHSSTWETIAMMVLMPPSAWVLKRELIWLPLVGWGIAGLRPIAIDRSAGHTAVGQVVEQGLERLSEGLCVVVFPEGTRMAPGETRRYGVSGALLAVRAKCPIVPVAHNAGDYWPRRGLLKKPGNIRLVFGPPITPEGEDARAICDGVQSWIESQVAELRRSARPPPS